MNKAIFLLLLVPLTLVGCQIKPIKNPPSNNAILCTQEAKICPDGSAVGRIGPNCEFPLCPNENNSGLIKPVAEFNKRITKKPFGILITPENSPVQPEKFTGYHNGVDIEYQDVETEVPVYAITDGVVIYSGVASGYGGVISIKHKINEKTYVAIYGHLDPVSLVKNNTVVTAGQKIGSLGDGYTSQTAGERKHLHFSLRLGDSVNLAGYLKTAAELSQWIDPQNLIK